MTDTTSSASETKAGHYEFSFTGKAGEYFGIWIVNLLLSILTLGIYTAWAKVRRLRYFYGNTWLDGHNFEYHAKPVQILIGRIIVVGVLLVLNVLASVTPIVSIVLLLVYIGGLPWLINKALSFNARMTSYRNVHFSFDGTYVGALWVFFGVPICLFACLIIVLVIFAVVFSAMGGFQTGGQPNIGSLIFSGIFFLGAIAAYAYIFAYISKRINEYIIDGMRFGKSDFYGKIPYDALVKNIGLTALVFFLPLMLLSGLSVAYVGSIGLGNNPDFATQLPIYIISAISYVVMIGAYMFYAAGVRNITFNSLQIFGGHTLDSSIPRLGFAWVVVSNLFASIISVGMLIPWAAIRYWKYIANHTAVDSQTGLDTFIEGQQPDGNVIAAEYLDIDGIDFGL